MIIYRVYSAADSAAPAFRFHAGRFSAHRVIAECAARNITGRVRVLWETLNRWGINLQVRELDLTAGGG